MVRVNIAVAVKSTTTTAVWLVLQLLSCVFIVGLIAVLVRGAVGFRGGDRVCGI